MIFFRLSLPVVVCMLFFSCTGYIETYGSYSSSVAQVNIAQAEAAKAYYDLKKIEIQQATALKVAAIQSATQKGGGGAVIFMGDSGGFNVKPVFTSALPQAPDSAPGAKYAADFGKAVVYGTVAGILGHEVFSTIRDVSGSVSNVTSTVANTHSEANQANTTTSETDNSVSVADSGNQTDNSVSVADSGNTAETTDNSVSTGDVDIGDKDSSVTNTTEYADSYNDQSDNSDNSDNSVTRPAVVPPVVVTDGSGEVVEPVVTPASP